MTIDELKRKQAEMDDSKLIELVEKGISKMCKTGGKSFTMTVPVHITDTDCLLSELVRRFKKNNDLVASLITQIDKWESNCKAIENECHRKNMESCEDFYRGNNQAYWNVKQFIEVNNEI